MLWLFRKRKKLRYVTYQEQIDELPSLNHLYAKKKLRELRLAKLQEMDVTELIKEFHSHIIDKELALIASVTKDIAAVRHKIEVLASECSRNVEEKGLYE